MAKVTSKLQVTIPKALAERSRIRAGDDIDWSMSSEGLRISPSVSRTTLSTQIRLELFDRATKRQRRRQRSGRATRKTPANRGWTRSELYNRGRSR